MSVAPALDERLEGHWELIATASGRDDAVRRSLAGLSPGALDEGFQGEALSPAMVGNRIEAVAARDVTLIAKVAKGWRRPAEIGDSHFWSSAWEKALRHLAGIEAVRRAEVDVPELEREVRLVFDPPPARVVSWRELCEQAQHGVLSYGTLRELSKCPLAEATLTADDLEEAPGLMLRLLRGKLDRLDGSAREHLAGFAQTWPEHDPSEAALALEHLKALDPDAFRRAGVQLGLALQKIVDPDQIIPSSYLLLGRGWTMA